MKTQWWIALAVVALIMLGACAAPAAAPSAQPAAEAAPDSGTVFDTFPPPDDCTGCVEAIQAIDKSRAIGYAFADGEIGVIVAPLSQTIQGDDDELIVGVAWSPMMAIDMGDGIPPFDGSAFVTIAPSPPYGGHLIGDVKGSSQKLDLSLGIEPVQQLRGDVAPIQSTIYTDGIVFALDDSDTRYWTFPNENTPAGRRLSAHENYPNQYAALRAEIDQTVTKLQEKGILTGNRVDWPSNDPPCLPPDQFAVGGVVGELESDSKLIECDPTQTPSSTCQADIIVGALAPPATDSGKTETDMCLGNPDSFMNLGVARVTTDIDVGNNTLLKKGWYLVKAQTDSSGRIKTESGPIVLVDGVEEESGNEITDQQIPATLASYVNARDDQGFLEISACKIWKCCVFGEKCR